MAKVVDSSIEYISPPSPQFPDHSDVSTFNSEVNQILPGRLSVTCIQAKNLKRKDQNQSKTRLNLFVQLALGPQKNQHVLSSKLQSDISHSPSFNNEIVSFDIQTPRDIVCFKTSDIKLKIEVIDSNPLESFGMGNVTISAMRFFQGLASTEWIPLYQDNDESSNSSIHLHFEYIPAKEGILELSKLEFMNLREHPSCAENNDASIYLEIGDFKRQSSLAQHDSKSMTFHTTRVKEYLDINKNNWFHPLKIQIILNGTNDVLFEYSYDFLHLISRDEDEHPKSIQLHCKEEKNFRLGTVAFEAKFFGSSLMSIRIEKAKSLVEINTSQQQLNPYVLIRSEGRASYPNFRSRTIRNGGLNPVWNEDVNLKVVDHYQLIVECYDYDLLSDTHQLIGSGQLSLMPAYRTGHSSAWVDLTRTNEVGATLNSGQINIITNFDEIGSKFPRFHKSNTSMKLKSTAVQNIDYVVSASAAQGVVQEMRNKGDPGETFTDEDISSTFSLLDLDHNGYIGSAELRHVLINMGFLITDEEVDTMISMLDKNGDGQVNFHQFSTMAKCREKKNVETLEVDMKSPDESLKNTNQGSKRRKLLLDFIKTNNIRQDDVLNLVEHFTSKHRAFISNKGSSVDSEEYQSVRNINFATFTDLLPIQATGESKNVFDMMDHSDHGQIDIRVLTLSLCSCLKSYSVEDKCSIIMDLFAIDERGVDFKDMNTILAGTHLKSEIDVTRKAQTIVTFVQKHCGSNHLSKQQLLSAASKFPNLFLPTSV